MWLYSIIVVLLKKITFTQLFLGIHSTVAFQSASENVTFPSSFLEQIQLSDYSRQKVCLELKQQVVPPSL